MAGEENMAKESISWNRYGALQQVGRRHTNSCRSPGKIYMDNQKLNQKLNIYVLKGESGGESQLEVVSSRDSMN